MPPLNLPPTYKDYERGRVLVAFNSTWESQQTVPSVAEPEPSLLVEPAWSEAVWKSTSESAYLRVDGVGERPSELHAIFMKTFLASRRARAVASRDLGTAVLGEAQTRTRRPSDTLDRLERAAPHSDRDTPKIEAQVELCLPRRFEATHTDFDLYEQGCEGLVGECTGLYEQAMDPALYIDVSKIADANRDVYFETFFMA